MQWGIPVPVEGFENKRIYVWFEAVIGYLSASQEWALTSSKASPDAWKPFWQGPCRTTTSLARTSRLSRHPLARALMGVGGLNLPYDIPANEFLTLQGR